MDDLEISPAVRQAVTAFGGLRPTDMQHENVQWLVYNIQQAAKMFETAERVTESTEKLASRVEGLAKVVSSAAGAGAMKISAAETRLKQSIDHACADLDARFNALPTLALRAFDAPITAILATLQSIQAEVAKVERCRQELATERGNVDQAWADLNAAKAEFAAERDGLRVEAQRGRAAAAELARLKRKGFFQRLMGSS